MTGEVLVTGVAGFIGSNVARSLSSVGRRVIGCDRLGRGGKWRNLVDVGLQDIVTPEALPNWLARNGGDLAGIVHMGAISATTETDVDLIVRDNVRTTLDLWEFCTRTGIALVYASSGAVYGGGERGFDDDSHPSSLSSLRPLNAYGWSKLFVDRRIAADAADGTAPQRWAGLRFFNVYGPGEDHKGDMRSVVAKLVPRVLDGEPARLFRSYRTDIPDGGQQRDFVHVDDVVAVTLWLLDSPDARSGIFNVGTGEARTWRDLALAVFAALGRDPAIEYVDMPETLRPTYQYFTEANMDRLRAAGWNASFRSLEDGVRAYVERTITA